MESPYSVEQRYYPLRSYGCSSMVGFEKKIPPTGFVVVCLMNGRLTLASE
jgi:hypothetical protein